MYLQEIRFGSTDEDYGCLLKDSRLRMSAKWCLVRGGCTLESMRLKGFL